MFKEVIMNINFELFKVFYFASKTLSYSEAAKDLFVTQSAISQSIKQLETQLECKLFMRQGKNMKLTPQGAILYEYVSKAYQNLESGYRTITEHNDLTKGSIRIGASDTISKYFLIDYLRQFKELYPNIKITIINKPSPLCIELLKDGHIDCAIVNINNKSRYNGLKLSKLREIKDTFIVGNAYKDLVGRSLSLNELSDYPILSLDSNSTTRFYYNKLMNDNDTYIKPEFELQSVDLLIEMTKANMGIAFVMDFAIQNKLRNGEVFELSLKEKISPRYIGVVLKDKAYLTPAAERFMELLHKDI